MMFTGIVTELGAITSIVRGSGATELTVEAPRTAAEMAIGDSVALNGVCLTAVDVEPSTFSVEVVDESLSRTSLGELSRGDIVNLERPMAASSRFDGHIVQGHVDGIGTVVSIIQEGEASRMRIALSSDLSRFTVEKGSIAVDGTSLTVTAVSEMGASDAWFEIVLIPHTLAVTVLGQADVGSVVNLETDVIAKYLERMIGGAR
jgi:riboflavin synthase